MKNLCLCLALLCAAHCAIIRPAAEEYRHHGDARARAHTAKLGGAVPGLGFCGGRSVDAPCEYKIGISLVSISQFLHLSFSLLQHYLTLYFHYGMVL